MKKLIYLSIVLILASCTAKQDGMTQALQRIKADYPLATLQDVYKSFYQDHFGPAHLIADTAAMRRYIDYELAEMAADSAQAVSAELPYYEPTGSHGRYVRVSLRCVTDSLISTDMLFDAFLESFACPPAQTSWADEWQQVLQTVESEKLEFANYEQDKQQLAAMCSQQQAVHHSEQYRKAYHPHYRIVRADIFQANIKPYLP